MRATVHLAFGRGVIRAHPHIRFEDASSVVDPNDQLLVPLLSFEVIDRNLPPRCVSPTNLSHEQGDRGAHRTTSDNQRTSA